MILEYDIQCDFCYVMKATYEAFKDVPDVETRMRAMGRVLTDKMMAEVTLTVADDAQWFHRQSSASIDHVLGYPKLPVTLATRYDDKRARYRVFLESVHYPRELIDHASGMLLRLFIGTSIAEHASPDAIKYLATMKD